ncbi:E3 ubiquitin-protein ligase TRIM58-like isoform X2 [Corvus cornix cornix]|uniref:E3 ubiquitin-protein ligase TRIM58-like isoform X2 n=1 Tax=Corvus cornix cornix TaxID=932674 RepID=UPI0019518E09|nr:E3 ubiquitin-protein ligase TRIM58-like isoform X2 [Corvus cornix cornix]
MSVFTFADRGRVNPEKRTQGTRNKELSEGTEMERWWQCTPNMGGLSEFILIWTSWWALEKIPGKIFKKKNFVYVGEQCLPHCKQSTGIHSHRGAQEYLSHQIKREENLESLGRGKTEEANTSQALESRLEKDLKQLSQQIQTLIQAFQNMQESTEHDLMIRTDLENKRGMTEEGNATMILESTWQKDLQQISHQLQNLQQILHNMQMSTQRDLQLLRTELENKRELSKVESYKGDVTLDADTAHPRLEISADGQKVKDTGVIRHVPSNEKRFDSHLFVLAKEGYTSGKHYWEVSVGRRRSWALGIALESVTRKGPLTLCPQNGFWAIGLADGRDCWAYTDRWTRLNVSRNLHKIGIFLNIPAKKLRFYNVHTGATLYTFSIGDGSSQEGKFIPFLSTGPATSEHEPEPLLIVQEFDDDDG